MLTLSKPLTSTQAKLYYQKDFSNAEGNYYSEGQTIVGQWQGKLAEQWRLIGEVTAEQYNRLADGQDPYTGEQRVQHHAVPANCHGTRGATREHRAGWDGTFSAPKSVSLTALAGSDSRVIRAHRESVQEALRELERFTQARLGGNHSPENTGKLAIATFEHDSARPVDGYAAPQLHTHAVIFNLTEIQAGQVKPLQPLELFRTQQYATAVYQSHLAQKLQQLGYEIKMGTNGAPEILGYSKEYLEANSLRSQQIKQHIEQYYYERHQQQEIDSYIRSHPEDYQQALEAKKKVLEEERDLEGPKLAEVAARAVRQDLLKQVVIEGFAEFRQSHVFDYSAGEAQIAAHRTRGHKTDLSREQIHARHLDMAQAYGNQPRQIIQKAQLRGPVKHDWSEVAVKAYQALTYARDRNQEREAVNDEREILRDALRRSLGYATPDQIRATLESHLAQGDFIRVAHYHKHSPARAFTTPQTIALERANIARVVGSQGKYDRLVTEEILHTVGRDHFVRFNSGQRSVVQQILSNQDQIVALQGKAGTGKTATLFVIREAAERQGYTVHGFAPTTRAAKLLEESGIKSDTLQKYLSEKHFQASESFKPHLYVLDEASLAGTRNLHEFFSRLDSRDRVLLVGDMRQHQAVEAGRPFEQLQKAGMQTAHLDEILRQKDPELKEVVEHLAAGEVKLALGKLQGQGRVLEIPDLPQQDQEQRALPAAYRRLQAIAMDFRSRPEGTLIISPENQARAELNLLVHQELQREGRVRSEEQLTPVLVNRQELTGADREWAMRYEAGDWIRYSRGSQRLGIKPGEYVRVLKVNAADNTLTVQRSSGQTLTYDPRRLHGVTVYRETQRAFAPGDRVQFTAPCRERQVVNRELGTLKTIDPKGQVIIQLDAGRSTIFNLSQYRHLDYGYAVTSHSSQGQTVDRALIYIDTEQTSPQALNSRLAYVAVSRARHEVRIYTNDIEKLAEALSRQTTKSSAVEAWQKGEEWEHSIHLPQPSLAPAAAQVAKPDSTRELAFNLQP